MIKLIGVEKKLGGQPVLQGIDLSIPVGKLTTIIGRSGEGKSVLLKHMIGLMQPDRGEVWVGDVEISRLSGTPLNDVRKQFAMLFQGAALFDSLSVFENVAFPLREKLRMKGPEVARRVEEKLEEVGLAGMGHKFPAELSGGMRKRAGLVVGVFVFVGILCLAYLSIKLGKLEMIGGDVYEVEAQFNSASGLKSGSTIEIAGVEVGRVRGITLTQDRAMVKLAVNKTVKLY